MDQTLEGVLRQVGTQNEALDREAIQEELDPIGLHDVASVNDRLAFEDAKFQEGKDYNELLEMTLTLDVVVLELFDYNGFRADRSLHLVLTRWSSFSWMMRAFLSPKKAFLSSVSVSSAATSLN